MAGTKIVLEGDGVGLVETRYFTFSDFELEEGGRIDLVTIAYETYGTLNEKKNNAILILHALSGDAHVAGINSGQNNPGWWDPLIGSGRAFDTNKYFIICSNVLGGCRGSTGPATVNAKTGRPYALDFPVITINDMVDAQKRLVDSFGVDKLLAVVGGSMGGMQVLSWLTRYPDKIRSAIPIATAARHSPQQIAFGEVGRQAIMADPQWKYGNYYDGFYPAKGLAVARMIGHITYMSDVSMADKFGRQRKDKAQPHKFSADFEVEGYLRYRGENFIKRFDANSYLYITKAMDHFDASQGKALQDVLCGIKARVMLIAFKSDWLYPVYQSKEILKACKLSGVDATYCEIESTYGHDAFLLEVKEETHLIGHFLKKVFYEYEVTGHYEI